MKIKDMLLLRSIDALAQAGSVGIVLLNAVISRRGNITANTFASCFLYLGAVQLVSCIVTLFLPSALTNRRIRITYLVFTLVLLGLGIIGLLFWVLFLPVVGLVMVMTTWYFIITIAEVVRLSRQIK